MLSSVGTSAPLLIPVPPGPDEVPLAPGRTTTRAPGGPAAETRAPAASSPPAATSAAATAGARAASSATAAGAKGTKGAKRPAGGSPTAAGYATASAAASASKPSSTTKKKAGPLAFLDDPRLSMEEKLLRLLAYLNDKWNKELDKKMKEFKQAASAPASGAGSGGSKPSSGGVGGLLKKAVSYATVAMPQLGVTLAALKDPAVRGILKNVAGPALAAAATAAGQPALAPLALRFGPDLVDAAASVASSATGEKTPATGGASTGKALAETAGGLGSDRNDQLKLMEMQRILDQQKEMFSLVSNLLRTTHDTRMAVIHNVR